MTTSVKKFYPPPIFFWNLFANGRELSSKVLYAYCLFKYMPNYLKLVTKLCHIVSDQPVNSWANVFGQRVTCTSMVFSRLSRSSRVSSSLRRRSRVNSLHESFMLCSILRAMLLHSSFHLHITSIDKQRDLIGPQFNTIQHTCSYVHGWGPNPK